MSIYALICLVMVNILPLTAIWPSFACKGTLKNNVCVCVNIQNHQKIKKYHPLAFIDCKCIHFDRYKIRWTAHFTKRQSFTLLDLLEQKTFNNKICMRTHNQLRYYTTISMKVTAFP